MPETAELRLDRQRIRLSGVQTALVLNPGSHVLELSAPSRTSASLHVTLGEGETRSETLSLGPPVALPPPPAPSPAPPRAAAAVEGSNGRRQLGFAFLGLGGVALVGASVSGGLMLREHAIVERECQVKQCSDAGLAAGARGRTLVVVSIASLGASVMGGVAGFYLLGSSSRKSAISAGVQVGAEGVSLRLAASL